MDQYLREGKQCECKQIAKRINPFRFEVDMRGVSLWYSRKLQNGWYHSKTLSISFFFGWAFNGVGAQWGYRDNGAKKENNDKCLDAKFTLGYIVFNYINWDFSDGN